MVIKRSAAPRKTRGPRSVAPEHIAERVALGVVIWNARQDAGLTQRALAELSGVSHNKFTDIEAGRTDIYLSTIQRIAGALGVTLSELFIRTAGNGAPSCQS